MKIASLFTNPRRIFFFVGIFLYILSFNVIAQDDVKPKSYRLRYISSVAKTNVEIKSPGVKIIKRGTSVENSAPALKKLKDSTFHLEKKTFELINEQRVSKGLAVLKWNPKIASLARVHSENMARHSFFSHKGLNGRTIDQRANDYGIRRWKSIGENIAYNKGFSNPCEFSVERWMLSTEHRINLLHQRWKESGIGIAVTEDGKYFFTQIFMDR